LKASSTKGSFSNFLLKNYFYSIFVFFSQEFFFLSLLLHIIGTLSYFVLLGMYVVATLAFYETVKIESVNFAIPILLWIAVAS
jgi:hypothetical protein